MIMQLNSTQSQSKRRSGIFAIAHIGPYKIYVGETSQLKQRWAGLMHLLDRGHYPDAAVQQAWTEQQGDRHFSFRTAQDIARNPDVIGLGQFVDDLCEEELRSQPLMSLNQRD